MRISALCLIFSAAFAACDYQREEVSFLNNYVQQTNAELINHQRIDFSAFEFQSKHEVRSRQLPNFNRVQEQYISYAKSCIKSVQNRESYPQIASKFELAFLYWRTIQENFKSSYPNCEKSKDFINYFGEMNESISNLYQVLAAIKDDNSNSLPWEMVEMKAFHTFNQLNSFLVAWGDSHATCRCHFDRFDAYLYSEKPVRVNQEAEFKVGLMPSAKTPHYTYEMGINQKSLKSNPLFIKFTPETAGLQTVDINAVVHKKNGDTVFLSKKIEIEVLE